MPSSRKEGIEEQYIVQQYITHKGGNCAGEVERKKYIVQQYIRQESPCYALTKGGRERITIYSSTIY